jgi:flagellar motor switch/type III secretory pathway protein FliN
MSAETPIAPQATEETPTAGATLAFSENTASSSTSPLAGLDVESPLAALRVQLDVRVPIPNFRVQDLLSLEKGRVLETGWSHGEDLPIWCGGVQLVWTEFEVLDQKLAARVTRLA